MSMHARNRIVALLIVAAAAGCATAPAAVVTRGTVHDRSSRTQAVVQGPMTLHAYAGFTGGGIFQAPAGVASGCGLRFVAPGRVLDSDPRGPGCRHHCSGRRRRVPPHVDRFRLRAVVARRPRDRPSVKSNPPPRRDP